MTKKQTTAKAEEKKEEVKTTPEVKTPEVQPEEGKQEAEEKKEEVKDEEETDEADDTTDKKEEKGEEPEKEEPKKKEKKDVIGSIKGGQKVHQGGFLKVKAIRGNSVEKKSLPKDIQVWLTNKGYGTNIYLKDKEWLERHNVDMKMVEKLKKFVSDNFIK